jgi:large subunit ribosomal protein L31
MKAELHPQSQEIKATCTCGHSFHVESTLKEDIHLDICAKCHPFYSGQQKIIDTAGQVERFRRKFGTRSMVDRANKADDGDK